MTADEKTQTEICEAVLRRYIDDNTERKILPTHVAIARRFLERQLELTPVYLELVQKLGTRGPGLFVFFDLVFDAAHFWSPDKMARARAERTELGEVNKGIARACEELATMLERRDELHNTSGFDTDTHYHVCKILEAAGNRNPLFKSWVDEDFSALYQRFDLKYWPSIEDFVRELGEDAARAGAPTATDPMTAAGTDATRASQVDFFRVLQTLIDKNSQRVHGHLPADFSLSDATLATLANCALDLGPEELKGADYVKAIRQRERKRLQRP